MEQMKPNISKRSFWDIDFETLDFEKHKKFIIEKVFEYGTLQDTLEIIAFYGLEIIKQEIIKANWLSNKTLNYCCIIFQLNKNDFKCYIKKQSNPELWNY